MLKGDKDMKKKSGWILFFFLVLIVFPAVCIFAHAGLASPPEDIQLRYNTKTQALLVTITHKSMFKGSHFIKYVEIKKNNNVVSIETYDSQPAGTFTYSYRVQAIEDDMITVTATCSKGDSKTSAVLTVK